MRDRLTNAGVALRGRGATQLDVDLATLAFQAQLTGLGWPLRALFRLAVGEPRHYGTSPPAWGSRRGAARVRASRHCGGRIRRTTPGGYTDYSTDLAWRPAASSLRRDGQQML